MFFKDLFFIADVTNKFRFRINKIIINSETNDKSIMSKLQLRLLSFLMSFPEINWLGIIHHFPNLRCLTHVLDIIDLENDKLSQAL